ncbi:hypothetical protein AWC23_15180 [Mycobacterium saskatchewanense]|uniref:Uncharacterized protein n=1 Tax=Mycobacterium saskatchewanense TaxID=220927 RepID=A0AAJ3NP65_9MYCO|nr:hypothetical protein AWC23_15180 [Mycobacterium saskatchewanense]
MALEIAAGAPQMPISPTPRAPNSASLSEPSTKEVANSGRSEREQPGCLTGAAPETWCWGVDSGYTV